MSNSVQKQRKTISLGYWISTFCEGTGIIVIPLFLVEMGIPASKIGITFFIYELAGILTNLIAGFFINRIGYKASFIISLALHSLASFGYLLLRPEMDMLIALIVLSSLRAIRSMGIELIRTTSSSYFKQFTKFHKKSRFTAVQLLQGGKDTVKGFGLLSGGILLDQVGFHNTFLILGAGTTISLISAMFLLDDFKERKQTIKSGFGKIKTNMKLLAFIRMFIYFSRDVWIIVPVPVFLLSQGIDSIQIATLLATSLIIFGVLQPLTGSLAKSKLKLGTVEFKNIWRYRDLIPIPTLLLLLIPLLLLVVPLTFTNIIIAIVLYHVFNAVATTPHNYLHLKFARRRRSSMDIAFYKTISQTGKLAAVFCSGYIYDIYGIKGCLGLSALGLILAMVIGMFLATQKRKESTLGI
ncbi:MAG: hypothetical protein CMP10_08060 [Zetaproteobacteria bacterium]|nr:hypothetical protein [Pseudobdellovibrionaceae bacterium]